MTPKIALLFVGLLSFQSLSAQWTLEKCQNMARANYPLVKQLDLIEKSTELTLSNIDKQYLPQISISAKATYQSDAIDITLPIPGNPMSLHQSKDQYQAVAEVNQTLWDGGVTSVRKKIAKSNSEIDQQKIEVELYTLRERVNQLYFGLLLLQVQSNQLELLKNELSQNLKKLESAKLNGVVTSSDLDILKVEILTADQKKQALAASQKIYLTMLSALIGEPLDSESVLEKPSNLVVKPRQFERPEMHLFNAQLDALSTQQKMEQTMLLPKLGLFLQGGYGRPGLNMFSDTFSPFYIGGMRLSLNLGSLYTRNATQASIENSKKMVQTSKETFLFNNNLKCSQYQVEIEKLKTLIQTDDAIVQLRTNIKNASSSKLQNGVSTVTDLLRDINAENTAKLQKSTHELQLLLQIEYLNDQSTSN